MGLLDLLFGRRKEKERIQNDKRVEEERERRLEKANVQEQEKNYHLQKMSLLNTLELLKN